MVNVAGKAWDAGFRQGKQVMGATIKAAIDKELGYEFPGHDRDFRIGAHHALRKLKKELDKEVE